MLTLKKVIIGGGSILILIVGFLIFQNMSAQHTLAMKQEGCLNLERNINSVSKELRCNCSYANYGTLGPQIKNTCLCNCEINLTFCSEHPEECIFSNATLKNPYVSVYILCEDINCVSYRME